MESVVKTWAKTEGWRRSDKSCTKCKEFSVDVKQDDNLYGPQDWTVVCINPKCKYVYRFDGED